jgi:hypothetical protein
MKMACKGANVVCGPDCTWAVGLRKTPCFSDSGWRDMYVLLGPFGIVRGGVQLGPLGTAATNSQSCQPQVIIMVENWWNDWHAKPKYSERTCPSAALSTTNTTCCPDLNRVRRCEKPASNRLSYGTAFTGTLNSLQMYAAQDLPMWSII